MASDFGFVYILGNDHMPNLIKIGCTERSPSARAEELSRPTGIPSPFNVLCYAEFLDFQNIEKKMHEWCSKYRVNTGREFFEDCLQYAVSLLWHHPQRLSFTDATMASRAGMYSSLLDDVLTEPYMKDLDDLWNPFGKKDAEQSRKETIIANLPPLRIVEPLCGGPLVSEIADTKEAAIDEAA